MACRTALKFHSGTHQRFLLDIAGHELSNFRPGHPRRVLLSWPLLCVVCRDIDGEWSATASIGPREELTCLAGWLAAIGSGEEADETYRFSEKFLRLDWTATEQNRGVLTICLSGDLLSESDPLQEDGERCLRFPLDSARLTAASETLRRLVVEHPEPSWMDRSNAPRG